MITAPQLAMDQVRTQDPGRPVDELRVLIGDLGKSGGVISPAVYDTAQVLRFNPPEQGVEPALNWLLSQQMPDGGWGNAAVPLARYIPTLAAVLALHELGETRIASEAVDAGLRFLASRTDEWSSSHIDLLPIAVEMILPWMLEDALRQGLSIDLEPFQALFDLRREKKRKLASLTISAGSAPAYSWEALDLPPDLSLLDQTGGVGHSPAATARWLQLAKRSGSNMAEGIKAAESYLEKSSLATLEGIPGVVPTVWPISVFEYIYGIHILSVNEQTNSREFAHLIQAHAETIESQMLERGGLGFSEHFIRDVDCTAVGMIALVGCGRNSISDDLILRYRQGSKFRTYEKELNPSVFSNAHALHALANNGTRVVEVEQFLQERQLAEGGWMSDKWHSSWLYTTLEVINSLLALGITDGLNAAKCEILSQQNRDGWWSSTEYPSLLDTIYAMTALEQLNIHGFLAEDESNSLVRAQQWLRASYDPTLLRQERLWMGKELYSPYRVDSVYALSTLCRDPKDG